jgi:DNA-binding transcriptional MocR family regulator
LNNVHINLPISALLNNTLGSTSFRVLLHLAQNASADRSLTTTQQEVADALGAKLRDVQQAFLQLQEEGFIDWKNKGARSKSTVRLLWSDAAAGQQPSTQALSPISAAGGTNASMMTVGISIPEGGTPRFVPPLPGILARIDVLEEQNEALARQVQDLKQRVAQHERLLNEVAAHLKLSALPAVASAAPAPAPVAPPPQLPEPPARKPSSRRRT